ncbi:neuronal acetylcholine receptor subunit alpha-3-like [Haliotis rufescens]|uniref:neuronal acetylcholine receptor subunit alpha-3-like n=1 Tax=Haliotis rufescens TaxID=6454 RepID=UPI00201F0441|nr:neuronal acetylcholine receptor subunit alpha-3-like [Haliotis rufescens]
MKLPYVLVLLAVCRSVAGSIDEMKRLYRDLFRKYSPKYRPLYNQSHHVDVHCTLNLLSIIEVDQVRQILQSNVWVNLTWRDEFLIWKSENYSGIKSIHPPLTDIWRPRLILTVSLEDRDVFKDDTPGITVYSDGTVTWSPGANFLTACKLDLTLFPFDVQTFEFRFLPASYDSHEVKLVSSLKTANTRSFTSNGEWIVSRSRAYTREIAKGSGEKRFSTLYIQFDFERRPTFFLLSVILPVVLLSFLNIFVFALPCECGEKVSYAVTCLLSLTLFMSIVSGLLPKSSDNIPLVTMYLTCLLGISVLSVVATILIVVRDARKKPPLPLFVIPCFWTLSFPGSKRKDTDEINTDGLANDGNPRGRVTGGRSSSDSGVYCISADCLCMVMFMAVWVCVTMGFFIELRR